MLALACTDIILAADPDRSGFMLILTSLPACDSFKGVAAPEERRGGFFLGCFFWSPWRLILYGHIRLSQPRFAQLREQPF
mmetsp:Transcript_12732/g.19245  ORF Transcript_12732/g.19245 Transcript_12732/m.19245 type:complete len:80 (+) Transcript_12732:19-258(+)